MTLAVLFWILMLFGFFLNGWGWVYPTAPPFTRWGGGLLLFLLLLILGWQVFGTPVHR